MTLDLADRERIKYELRRDFGSVFAFEDAKGLPRKSVSDFLRGKPNQRVRDAINATLDNSQSDKSANSSGDGATHRLNAEGR